MAIRKISSKEWSMRSGAALFRKKMQKSQVTNHVLGRLVGMTFTFLTVAGGGSQLLSPERPPIFFILLIFFIFQYDFQMDSLGR